MSNVNINTINNKVYILGGAQTDFERNWKKEGKGIVALLKEILADGLTEAGLTYEDVKTLNADNRVACFIGNFIAEKYTNQGVVFTGWDVAFPHTHFSLN